MTQALKLEREQKSVLQKQISKLTVMCVRSPSRVLKVEEKRRRRL